MIEEPERSWLNKSDAELTIERVAYTIEEAAAALGIGHARMGALVRVGRVPHVLFGQRVLIGKRALEEWLTEECLRNVSAENVGPPVVLAPRRARRRA
jgi:excisionase family DNA binding protein